MSSFSKSLPNVHTGQTIEYYLWLMWIWGDSLSLIGAKHTLILIHLITVISHMIQRKGFISGLAQKEWLPARSSNHFLHQSHHTPFQVVSVLLCLWGTKPFSFRQHGFQQELYIMASTFVLSFLSWLSWCVLLKSSMCIQFRKTLFNTPSFILQKNLMCLASTIIVCFF